ncbi:unnamed protein product [Vitrella brassicaformis CCMP3155]|uniref:Uncharacterized protein n=1 Tax=Vitrella brassicaformis (strain CCMP3155) TaxID=1169540 RepID=A0A0G4FRX0_VITBC|nr:unnamed protein product [Vitrella brassicaformis CCMP3155]|eukprot:CEM16850.1 unnamed protein product [Vitrella brassicaformis CCMP3155]
MMEPHTVTRVINVEIPVEVKDDGGRYMRQLLDRISRDSTYVHYYKNKRPTVASGPDIPPPPSVDTATDPAPEAKRDQHTQYTHEGRTFPLSHSAFPPPPDTGPIPGYAEPPPRSAVTEIHRGRAVEIFREDRDYQQCIGGEEDAGRPASSEGAARSHWGQGTFPTVGDDVTKKANLLLGRCSFRFTTRRGRVRWDADAHRFVAEWDDASWVGQQLPVDADFERVDRSLQQAVEAVTRMALRSGVSTQVTVGSRPTPWPTPPRTDTRGTTAQTEELPPQAAIKAQEHPQPHAAAAAAAEDEDMAPVEQGDDQDGQQEPAGPPATAGKSPGIISSIMSRIKRPFGSRPSTPVRGEGDENLRGGDGDLSSPSPSAYGPKRRRKTPREASQPRRQTKTEKEEEKREEESQPAAAAAAAAPAGADGDGPAPMAVDDGDDGWFIKVTSEEVHQLVDGLRGEGGEGDGDICERYALDSRLLTDGAVEKRLAQVQRCVQSVDAATRHDIENILNDIADKQVVDRLLHLIARSPSALPDATITQDHYARGVGLEGAVSQEPPSVGSKKRILDTALVDWGVHESETREGLVMEWDLRDKQRIVDEIVSTLAQWDSAGGPLSASASQESDSPPLLIVPLMHEQTKQWGVLEMRPAVVDTVGADGGAARVWAATLRLPVHSHRTATLRGLPLAFNVVPGAYQPFLQVVRELVACVSEKLGLPSELEHTVEGHDVVPEHLAATERGTSCVSMVRFIDERYRGIPPVPASRGWLSRLLIKVLAVQYTTAVASRCG